MDNEVLIVPGYQGSGPEHWQSWIEGQLPCARRVSGIDWDAPVLARWSETVRAAIDASPVPVWLLAHSFGCLASVVAASDRSERVAGVFLVAPADPERFSPLGVRAEQGGRAAECVAASLPHTRLPFPTMIVASSDDPWARLSVAARWSGVWGSRLLNLGAAGHINVTSGFGPWPQGLALFDVFRFDATLRNGERLTIAAPERRGRGSTLARLRHRTRLSLSRY